MSEEPAVSHTEKSAFVQESSSGSTRDVTSCLFSGPELLLILLVFFAAALAVEIEGFDSPMIYDSAAWIAGNSHVFAKRQPLAVVEIMSQRPLFMLSLYLNYAVHGMDPIYFRVFNALILAAAGVALMVMLNMIILLHPSRSSSAGTQKRAIIFLMGLLFVVHPLQVFAVLYIWQRETLMACLFYFSALAAYAAGRGRAVPNPMIAYALTALFFFLGLMCKENLITLPVTIMLVEFVFFNQSLKDFTKRAAATGIVALALFLIYLFVAYLLHGAGASSAKPFERLSIYFQESGISLINVILTESRVWFMYLASCIAPSVGDLQLVRVMEVSASLFDPPVTALACSGLVAIAALGFALRTREPLVSFGLLFFCVALLPESLLLPQYLLFGYRAILPMAGIALILTTMLILFSAMMGRKLPPSGVKAVLVVGMCLAVAYLAITTRSVTSRWGPMWIWERSFAALPQYSSRVEISPYLDVLLNYGTELTKSGDLRGALELFQQAVEIPAVGRSRKKERILFNLGIALSNVGHSEEAIDRFKQAIQVNPSWALPYISLGTLLLQAGDGPAALENLRTAVRVEPSLPESHCSLGKALLVTGDNEQAVQVLRKALELRPNYPDASASLGKSLLNLDRLSEAVDHLKKAISAFPQNAELYLSLATAHEKLGMVQEAGHDLKRVLEIEPSHQEAKRKLESLSPAQRK